MRDAFLGRSVQRAHAVQHAGDNRERDGRGHALARREVAQRHAVYVLADHADLRVVDPHLEDGREIGMMNVTKTLAARCSPTTMRGSSASEGATCSIATGPASPPRRHPRWIGPSAPLPIRSCTR